MPASLNETKPHARHVCGKYPIEVERAVQHALALVVPGARYAAREEAPHGAAPSLLVVPGRDVVAREAARAAPARYLLGAAPTAAASLVIALPVSQRAAYRTALDRLKRRWYAADLESWP